MTKADVVFEKIAVSGRKLVSGVLSRLEFYGAGPDARKWVNRVDRWNPVIHNTLDMPANELIDNLKQVPDGGILTEPALNRIKELFPNPKKTSPEVVGYIKKNVTGTRGDLQKLVNVALEGERPPMNAKREMFTDIKNMFLKRKQHD